MISFCYMMIFILNGNTFPGIEPYLKSLMSSDTKKIFKLAKKYKSETSLFQMSQLIKLRTGQFKGQLESDFKACLGTLAGSIQVLDF